MAGCLTCGAPRLRHGGLAQRAGRAPLAGLAAVPSAARSLAPPNRALPACQALTAGSTLIGVPRLLELGRLQQHGSSRRTVRPAAAAAGGQQAAAAAAAVPEQQRQGLAGALVGSVRDQFAKLDGLWDRFIPMSALFFLMAFINTIIDSLKDSLVITAVGGGTEVIPYLTVYAVLPSSLLFLVAYSWGTQRFSREKLFNIIIGVFLAFYGSFALLYPHHDYLHLDILAARLVPVLPSGLSGLVGMVRNWLFTLFYCVSELWGDVVLSLLFWGLANETTSIEDAPLLYPLFGIGANVAQTVAGRALRLFSDASGSSHLTYAQQLQCIMGLCVGVGGAILLLHAWISRTFPKNPKGSTAAKMRATARQATRQAAADAASEAAAAGGHHHSVPLDLEASVHGLNYCSLEEEHAAAAAGRHSNGAAHGNGAALPQQGAAAHAAAATAASSSSSVAAAGAGPDSEAAAAEQQQQQQRGGKKNEAMSMQDAWQFLRRSPQIRCLAVMALAQGITTNLLDLAWKHYLHKLATTPAAYSAFLGDTAMWTGIVTGTLMFASPLLFDRVGWRGVACATPNFMMLAGLPFFGGCIAFTFMAGSLAAVPAHAVLFALVITGAALQVFSRGAKFSLFKPAEEMVYIGLDDESRTKGKAAIDVVGAQSGKSIGSMLQQALLILSGGTLGGILPLLAIFYAAMLRSWTGAVDDLADHYDPSHAHRVSVAGSIDEEDDVAPLGGDVAGQGSELQPAPAL